MLPRPRHRCCSPTAGSVGCAVILIVGDASQLDKVSSRSVEGGRVPHSASLCGRATRFIGAGRRAAAPAVLDIQTMIWNQFCAVGFTNQHDQVLCCYAAVTANSYIVLHCAVQWWVQRCRIMRTVERAFMSTME